MLRLVLSEFISTSVHSNLTKTQTLPTFANQPEYNTSSMTLEESCLSSKGNPRPKPVFSPYFLEIGESNLHQCLNWVVSFVVFI
jgi:hypothetical protein